MIPHPLTVGLGEGDTGRLVPVLRQIHAKGAGDIVVNEHGHGSGFSRFIGFFREIDGTAGTDGHLAGQVDSGPVVANPFDQNIFQGLPGQRFLQGLVAGDRFCIEDSPFLDGEIPAGVAHVVSRGYSARRWCRSRGSPPYPGSRRRCTDGHSKRPSAQEPALPAATETTTSVSDSRSRRSW